jgi:hypothetical protein
MFGRPGLRCGHAYLSAQAYAWTKSGSSHWLGMIHITLKMKSVRLWGTHPLGQYTTPTIDNKDDDTCEATLSMNESETGSGSSRPVDTRTPTLVTKLAIATSDTLLPMGRSDEDFFEY